MKITLDTHGQYCSICNQPMQTDDVVAFKVIYDSSLELVHAKHGAEDNGD